MSALVVGIDLAGSPSRPTGFCTLHTQTLHAETQVLSSDEEILRATLEANPSLVCVDAPLALPRGRCCLRGECECRKAGHLRECDRWLLRRGIKGFPPTLGPMRRLTLRGIELRRRLEARGQAVLEVYPGATQDLLGIPRKGKGAERLRVGLRRLGIGGDVAKPRITPDELDAITAAYVGKLHLEGKTISVGDPEEVLMALPKPGLGRVKTK